MHLRKYVLSQRPTGKRDFMCPPDGFLPGKLVPGKSVGGLTRLRHGERHPWQPCDREPPREAAPPGTVTLKKILWKKEFLPNPILTWNPLAKIGVGVVGEDTARIQCAANDSRRSAKLQAKYIAQHEPALPRPMDHPKDHVLPRTRRLTALAQA